MFIFVSKNVRNAQGKGFAACFLDGHDAARRGQEPLCADYPARRYRVGQHAAGFRGSQRCGRRDEKRRSAENPHFRCYTQRKLVDARLSDIAGYLLIQMRFLQRQDREHQVVVYLCQRVQD